MHPQLHPGPLGRAEAGKLVLSSHIAKSQPLFLSPLATFYACYFLWVHIFDSFVTEACSTWAQRQEVWLLQSP